MDSDLAKDGAFAVSIPVAVLAFAGAIIARTQEQYEAALACAAVSVFFAIVAVCLAPGVYRRHRAEEEHDPSLDETEMVSVNSRIELTLDPAENNTQSAAPTP